MKVPFTIAKVARDLYQALDKSQPATSSLISQEVEDLDTSIYGRASDSIGEHILSFNPDTNNLDMEFWDKIFVFDGQGYSCRLGPAQIFREDTKPKLKSDIKKEVQESYELVNAYMVRAVTNEYRTGEPRTVLREPNTGMALNASDFRWAGDIAGVFVIGRNKNTLMQYMRNVLGDAINFIKYLIPLASNTVITPIAVPKKIEGQDTVVDIKGNRIIPRDDEEVAERSNL